LFTTTNASAAIRGWEFDPGKPVSNKPRNDSEQLEALNDENADGEPFRFEKPSNGLVVDRAMLMTN
jgi:hypothetical protein